MERFEKHQPSEFSQIAFAMEEMKDDLMDYATGVATNNILLHGEFGTGKTTIAKAIAKQRLKGADAEILNAKRDIKFSSEMCLNITNWSMVNDEKAVLIIDEVDRFSKKEQDGIVACIDDLKRFGLMFILTTNYLDKLDKALVSRCSKYHIGCLTPAQALPTAERILAAEDINYESKEWLLVQLKLAVSSNSTKSDWRSYGQIIDRIIRRGIKNTRPSPTLKIVK